MIYIAIVSLLALLAAGVSIYLVLGIVSATAFMVSGASLPGMLQTIVDHLNSPTLIAVPFFVIAATFMQRGGVAAIMVDAAAAWVRPFSGGLALVCVLAATIFSAISGSSVATALAMGTILIPAMLKHNYGQAFSLGVVGASGTLGILIPPSLALIVFGVVSDTSIPQLFLAGLIPGLLQAALFAAYIIYYAKKNNLKIEQTSSQREFVRLNIRALPALSVPILVLGGIYTGKITVTESAALSALLAILLSIFIYKQCKITDIIDITAEGIKNSASILFIVAFALIFGHLITESGIPQKLVLLMQENDLEAWQFLLMMNLIMLFLGMFLEVITVILITLPIVLPLLGPLGISPIHYAIIVTINMELALLTPPIGLNLYILTGISKAPLNTVIKGIAPFLLLLTLLLLMVTFIPSLSTFLPNYIYG